MQTKSGINKLSSFITVLILLKLSLRNNRYNFSSELKKVKSKNTF